MEDNTNNELLEQIEEPETPDSTPETPVSFTDDPEIAAFIELKVNEGIQKALQGKSPRANTTDPTEQEYKNFARMSYKERLNLFNTNPQVYNKLSKGAIQ